MIVIHEVGHFVSCSFQMVNGKNLTQTKEWKKIYKSEKRKYVSEAGFEQVENVYAATSANEFFAECFHTSYLEVVNPTSYELIKFLHFIAVANTPATTGEFFHSLLKLRY